MTALSPEVWDAGLSYEAYRATVERNHAVFDEVYASPSLGPADLDLLEKIPPLRILAIAEDWCPDVYHTLPTWARVAERLDGWDLRVFPLVEHPELMDSFVWEGGRRRIPVYAFYDPAGRVRVWWSGRSGEAEEELARLLAGRHFKDLGEAERTAVGRAFHTSYETELRRRNFEEILRLLAAHFHLPMAPALSG